MSRELPHVPEMEKKVLSACMLQNGEIIPAVSEILTADDFYRPENKVIFTALLKVYETGNVDALTVIEELRRVGKIEQVTRVYIFDLVDYEFTIRRAVGYAKEIREKSQLRQLIRLGEELADRAQRAVEPVEELLATAEKKLLAASNQSSQNMEAIEPIALRTLKHLGEVKNGGGLLGVSTGFIDLNYQTGGFRNSDLIILAARPSMGKTALALNMALEASKYVETAIFSLEMSKEQLTQRLFSSISGVDARRIVNADLQNSDFQPLLEAAEILSQRKLFIDDTAGLTLAEIRARARARRLKHEQGLGLIVIDYIQLMQGSKEFRGNRVQEVSEISRGLKALARELNIPILALSQLSRSVEMRAEKKPQLSDLRESGSLEQDADIVMFLYREEYYNQEDFTVEGLAELIIAKNRNGATGKIDLQFEKKNLLFRNLTKIER